MLPLIVRFAILAVIIFLLDLYFYQAILTLIKNYSPARKQVIKYIYWGLTTYTMIFLLVVPSIYPIQEWNKLARVVIFSSIFILFIPKIIGAFFLLIDDLVRLVRWGITFMPQNGHKGEPITRIEFISRIGLLVAAIPMVSLIWGIIKGAYNYKVVKEKIIFPNLPESFNGLKIVQISDVHSGSFLSEKPLETAINLINLQKPDLVLFTGDLVNDRAEEAIQYQHIFSKIKAPMGVYTVLGNHDYGDYVQWETPEKKKQNLDNLIQLHKNAGWDLLINENRILKKGTDEIAIIGVENWGANMRFPKYGKLKEAYEGTENTPFKILLSHDPSHWDKQIRTEFSSIDLTLSGHTHGMQFGIEIPGFKWSPSQYFYKQWAGLYKEANQYLYVNRGLGFLGYPGRVGIMPEITVLELFNKA
jgi:uncharacterized protein